MIYNRVIKGDSDTILKEFAEEGLHFDLICTDPPYNLNKDFGNDSDKLELEDFLKITEYEIFKIFEAFNHCCFYCFVIFICGSCPTL